MTRKPPDPPPAADAADVPMLSEAIRQRLGQQLQRLYEPDFKPQLDGRIAELLLQLGKERSWNAHQTED